MFSFLKYKKFTFGDQAVSQFILFECKFLFSIIFYYFHESEGFQDRFHDHAFNAISLKIFGEYEEHILSNDKNTYIIKKRTEIFKYFPKNVFHRISKSNGCLTLLFSGPWDFSWKEYKNGIITKYTSGRIILNN